MEQMALLQDPLPELQDQQMLLPTQKINPKQMNQKILLLLMMSNYVLYYINHLYSAQILKYLITLF